MPNKEIFDVQDEQDFEERVLNSNNPVVVSFEAPNYEACKIVNCNLEKAAKHDENDISIAKVDVTKFKDLSVKNDVQKVPTLAVADDGEIHSHKEGMQNISDIKHFLHDTVHHRHHRSKERSFSESLAYAKSDKQRYY